MMKERTDCLLSHIDDYVEKECPELTITQILGYLIHRINLKSKKMVAKVGCDLFTETADAAHTFHLDKAFAIMHELVLSKEQIRKLR